MYAIRLLGDPVLQKECQTIEVFDSKLATLARQMHQALIKGDTGIGLAANQVGISKQIFVYDGEYLNLEGIAIVNPRLVEGDGVWSYDEGCLSIPDFFYRMDRPKQIHVVGQDLNGDELHFELDELASRLFQHEMDHLNGLTMFDRIPAEELPKAIAHLEDVRSGKSEPRRRRRRNNEPEL